MKKQKQGLKKSKKVKNFDLIFTFCRVLLLDFNRPILQKRHAVLYDVVLFVETCLCSMLRLSLQDVLRTCAIQENSMSNPISYVG